MYMWVGLSMISVVILRVSNDFLMGMHEGLPVKSLAAALLKKEVSALFDC